MKSPSGHEKRERLRRQKERSEDEPEMIQRLSKRLLLPVANETDAEATCAAVRRYVNPQVSELVAVHVIEKTPGYPDKLPFAAALERAEEIFSGVHDCFAGAGHRVSTEIRYGQSITKEIFEAAEAIDATAIGFTPQQGKRSMKILTGDVGFKLVTTNPRPVIVFPHPSTDQSSHVESPDHARDEFPIDDVVLPISSETDAETTRQAVLPYLPRGSRVIVVHVVRRRHRRTGSGDQALAESREIRAQRILDRASEWLEGAGFQTVTRLEYAVDVIGAIDDVADEEDADVIVITPRKTARWRKLLSGDVTYKLTYRMNRPVIVLPAKNEDQHQ